MRRVADCGRCYRPAHGDEHHDIARRGCRSRAGAHSALQRRCRTGVIGSDLLQQFRLFPGGGIPAAGAFRQRRARSHFRRDRQADRARPERRHDLDDPASEQIERAEKTLFELATAGQIEGGFRPFGAALTSAIDNAEAAFKKSGKTVGVATGFLEIDKMLGGLHPSDLIVLAGRPSMGKTALATNIAFNAAKAYKPARTADGRVVAEDGAVVGFFSLEMSAEQLATRILAEESGISSDRIRRGAISSEDFEKLMVASGRLQQLKLFVDDTPALSVAALRTRARR